MTRLLTRMCIIYYTDSLFIYNFQVPYFFYFSFVFPPIPSFQTLILNLKFLNSILNLNKRKKIYK